MKTCIWYNTSDKNPDESGYYLAYRGWGIAGKSDSDSDYGPVYYDKRIDEWRDYDSVTIGHTAFVYYWTEADPEQWVDRAWSPRSKTKKEVPAAVQIAWEQLQDAVKKYETLRALTR